MTQIETCNRALAVIGHDRTISSISETSSEAQLCARFHPAAKNNVLSAYNWDFACVETTVSLTGERTTWSVPADMLKLVGVRDADGNALRSERSGGSVYIYRRGSETEATARYVSSGTLDANLPHLVAEAVVYELAALLFGPVVGNVQDSQGTALFASYTSLAGAKLQAAITAAESERAYLGGPRSPEGEKKTEIANRALAKLGADSTVADFATDQTPVAARMRLLMPSSFMRVLRLKDWDFAAVEYETTLAGADAAGFCRYDIPSDCALVVRVMDARRNPVETYRNRDFLMVRSPGERVTVRYVSKDFDLSEAPDDFTDLVATDLADRLAPTVLRDAKAAQAVQAQLRAQFGETDMKEANETAFAGAWRNPFVAARD